MPSAEWKCVAFDLDGTLVDSFPALRRAYASFLTSFGMQESEEEFARLNGPSMDTVVARLKDWRRLPGGELELRAEYRRHVAAVYRGGIPAMPGAAELLRLAQARGWRRALVTSSPRNVVDHVLAGLRWEKAFDVLACGDEVIASKPAPAIYRLACERLACPPAHCVAIEDAEAGVLAAKGAGMRVIAVGTTMPLDRLRCADLTDAAEILGGNV
jgi:HAD superfamily hydrolase (TIGR01509 family)